MIHDRLIVAVDFDGVLCEDRFPYIGEVRAETVGYIRTLQAFGIDTILWTSRYGVRLAEAVKWCSAHGLRFVAINDNTPDNIARYGSNPRKVFAHIYIDDRSSGGCDLPVLMDRVITEHKKLMLRSIKEA